MRNLLMSYCAGKNIEITRGEIIKMMVMGKMLS